MAMTILICDDEPDIRTAMRRTFRGHEIEEVDSPRAALALLKARSFDAIVSDFSMESDSDGLDLLYALKLQYPEMIRFLVTANRELEVAVRAINEGAVHRFFLKPWDDHKLRSALEIVFHSRHPGPPPSPAD